MKIVWLCPYPIQDLKPKLDLVRDVFAHAAPWIVNLSSELAKKSGIKLTIITHAAAIKKTQNFHYQGIEFYVLKYSFPFTYKGYPEWMPLHKISWYSGFVHEALSIINQIEPDIIHAHGTEDAYSWTAIQSNYPNLISIQGVISELYKIKPSLSFYFQKKIETKSLELGKNFAYRTFVDKKAIYKCNKNAKLYFLSEAISDTYFEYNWTLPKKPRLVFVGYLSELKGMNVLIDAVRIVKDHIPEIEVEIIGPSGEKYLKSLKKRIKHFNLGHSISFSGKRGSRFIGKSLSESSIFVLPSFMENSPNSLAEAMIVGTPCIASNVGGIPSMIEDGKTGILVPVNDAMILAKKIEELLSNSNLLKSLSTNARLVSRKRHKKSIVADRTIQIYKEITHS